MTLAQNSAEPSRSTLESLLGACLRSLLSHDLLGVQPLIFFQAITYGHVIVFKKLITDV